LAAAIFRGVGGCRSPDRVGPTIREITALCEDREDTIRTLNFLVKIKKANKSPIAMTADQVSTLADLLTRHQTEDLADSYRGESMGDFVDGVTAKEESDRKRELEQAAAEREAILNSVNAEDRQRMAAVRDQEEWLSEEMDRWEGEGDYIPSPENAAAAGRLFLVADLAFLRLRSKEQEAEPDPKEQQLEQKLDCLRRAAMAEIGTKQRG